MLPELDTENKLQINRIVALAIETLDPKDALQKYSALGAEVLGHARWQKSEFPKWAKEDFYKLCDQIGERVSARIPVGEHRMDRCARIHLWVEAMKPLVPRVERLSYFQVTNKFLPTLRFDPVDLTGEIKDEWLTWVRMTVERQIGGDPLSLKELDEAIADQKEEIALDNDASRKRQTPDQKARAARRVALAKVTEMIDSVLFSRTLDGTDLIQVLEKVAGERGMRLPSVGFDPTSLTSADCRRIAKVMQSHGKLAEMVALRDHLDAFILTTSNQ
jgi:hypothetical protein